jgi:parallel beta-helix repeat protein
MKKHLILPLILFLLLSTSFIGVSNQVRQKRIDKPSLPTSKGNWLYVGGTGPGNYSSIQAAINDSADGDTVFVYAASSPYYENLIVNTSITLLGEDRNTTVIDGKQIDDPLWIKTSYVTVNGFTITNSSCNGFAPTGVRVIEKKTFYPDDPPLLTNVCISNCIIKNNEGGIRLYSTHEATVSSCLIENNTGSGVLVISSSHVSINDCDIIRNGNVYIGGVIIGKDPYLTISENITIFNCFISKNFWNGISVTEASRNISISYNYIFENTNYGIIVSESKASIFKNHICNNGVGAFLDAGVLVQDCLHGVLLHNNSIERNRRYGVFFIRSLANRVIHNNFIENTCNAFFRHFSVWNHWHGNYWTDWIGVGPKLIKGTLGDVFIPWVNFDWHPAQEPQAIEVL